jgi:hypothetical protein
VTFAQVVHMSNGDVQTKFYHSSVWTYVVQIKAISTTSVLYLEFKSDQYFYLNTLDLSTGSVQS